MLFFVESDTWDTRGCKQKGSLPGKRFVKDKFISILNKVQGEPLAAKQEARYLYV